MINAVFKAIGISKTEFLEIDAIQNPTTDQNAAMLTLTLKCKTLLSLDKYQQLRSKMMLYFKNDVHFIIEIIDNNYPYSYLNEYIQFIITKNTSLQLFNTYIPLFQDGNLIYPLMNISEEHQQLLLQELAKYGINVELVFKDSPLIEEPVLNYKAKVTPAKQEKPKPIRSNQYLKRHYETRLLKEVFTNDVLYVQVEGTIFSVDERKFANGNGLVNVYIKDEDNAILGKMFYNSKNKEQILNDFKVNQAIQIRGKVDYDNYNKQDVLQIESYEKIIIPQREDNAKEKRVELHLHTKFSEMDGVSSIDQYVQSAAHFNHKAIAVTDHHNVQVFPYAQKAIKNINKNRDEKMKMIYGVEMSMVEDRLSIVYNSKDLSLEDARYCILDVETTGLSTFDDHIIEFGGQHLNGTVLETATQFFVKSPVPIPDYIASLTNIDDQLLKKSGLDIEEALDKIVEFISDRIIVAHNAEFDFNFINDTLIRYGREPLTNPVIDTLHLARAILKERSAYRLGNIARHYGIKYDQDVAHRADYDTKVLADVFLKMMASIPEVKTLTELQEVQDETSFMKLFDSHICVLVKNKAGLKQLFELITLSHTKYLTMRNSKTWVARIVRSELAKRRENLLFGSACSNGEIFELALNRSIKRLEEAMEFYDYIEIQPKNCYRHLIGKTIRDEQHLEEVLKRIATTAEKLNRLVVATSDAHYVETSQANVREVLINVDGVGRVQHPLFIRDSNERKQRKPYHQHFLTTDEMLEEFAYFSQEKAYEYVVKNTNIIADSIEEIYPIHDKLYPPVIENCDQELTRIVYEKAHAQYGDELPKIVEERLEKELSAIIGSGYHVVYYISHLLVKKSNEDGYIVGSRGSVGSSLVATMSGITEVNPLIAHYYCKNCQYSEFFEEGYVASGFDLPDKNCPKCGHLLTGDGHEIPFETFLGFEGDKVPDIDLNFSGVYQPEAHLYTREVFGKDYVYRAGTIGSIAEKNAIGYIREYERTMDIPEIHKSLKERLKMDLLGTKRSTGQHPGGIIVIPDTMDVHDFTPVQYPANDPSAEWKTTHFEFSEIHDNVLKLDILGHLDPTSMRFLEKLSGIKPEDIPLNDPQVYSLFYSTDALKIDKSKYKEVTGAVGIPEFGTEFVRGMLEATRPKNFSELVQISGLSHGTDVWLGNAQVLIQNQTCTIKDVIGCRDDIMTYLIHKGLPAKTAFSIMESVRKGKGLNDEWKKIMREHNVEDWYIQSCLKIKYMFPKAHAVAYVLMAIRTAWYKVYKPLYYYSMFFSIRSSKYDIVSMIKGETTIRSKMAEIKRSLEENPKDPLLSSLYTTLELSLEMVLRGYRFSPISLELSMASEFIIDPNDERALIPPFSVIDGLGESVAQSIVDARNENPFISKEDLLSRTRLSSTGIKVLESLGIVDQLSEKNQLSLFD